MRSEIRKQLTDEFPELLNQGIVLPKEVYAHFGLVFFKFALVEHSLINIFVFISVGEKFARNEIRNREQWESSFDEAYSRAVSLTFGNLAKTAISAPEFSDMSVVVQEIKKLRDYFAHHFMRDEAGYFETDDGCWFLLEKIADVRSRVLNAEEMLKSRFALLCKRIGMPQPSDAQMETAISGYREEFAKELADGNPRVGWEN